MPLLGRAIRRRWLGRMRLRRGPARSSCGARRAAAAAVAFGARARGALRAVRQLLRAGERQHATEAWDLAAGGLIVVAVIVATW
jgi:hypothetical protein